MPPGSQQPIQIATVATQGVRLPKQLYQQQMSMQQMSMQQTECTLSAGTQDSRRLQTSMQQMSMQQTECTLSASTQDSKS